MNFARKANRLWNNIVRKHNEWKLRTELRLNGIDPDKPEPVIQIFPRRIGRISEVGTITPENIRIEARNGATEPLDNTDLNELLRRTRDAIVNNTTYEGLYDGASSMMAFNEIDCSEDDIDVDTINDDFDLIEILGMDDESDSK